ncbi:glycosyltransferase family 4 protein [Rhodocaloribacter sp.]
MNKVVHMTSVHTPFDTRIFHKECMSLRKMGYEVVLVVPHEKDEEVEGIKIKAVSQPESIFQRLFSTVYKVYRTALREDADLYHFHDPELLLAGWALKMRGKKVVYDAHENFRLHMLNKRWIPSFSRPALSLFLGGVENFVVSRIDGIVAASSFVAKNFPASKTTVIEYYPDKQELTVEGKVPYLERKNIVIWTGRSSRQRGAVEMVEAIEQIPDSLEAELRIVGILSPSQLVGQLKTYPGWKRVHYTGWVAYNQVKAELSKAKIGLCVVHPNPNNFEGHPRKLFEYMGAGLPVIASNFPKWKELIESIGCGLTVDPFDAKALSDAITWLLENPDEAKEMGERGREAVMNSYNWENESVKLGSMYQELLQN